MLSRFRWVGFAAVVALGWQVNCARAVVLFSYDATTGQLPTSQGWSAFEVDTTGPLTAASTGGAVTGTAAANANVAMELVGGINTLHIRDTLTDTAADLPTFFYPWTPAQQQLLLDGGLKYTVVAQVLTNSGSNSNTRIGFNGTLFETQNDNINADQTVQYQTFGTAPFLVDGTFHTMVIAGQKVGNNFDFTLSIDGGAPTALTPVTNPAPVNFESTPYFGALSSAGRNTDILVRSVVMETLGLLPPQVATITRTNGSATGSIVLQNNAAPLAIAGYSILSGQGALHAGQWTSITDNYDLSGNHLVDPNDDWIELSLPASRDNLSEFEPDGDGATLATGQTISFGNVWIQNANEDISMQLLLTDGTQVPVTIKYAGNGGNAFVFGDLDFDGDFDLADFTGKFVPGFGVNTTALSAAEKYQAGDFNKDNVVDEYDFLTFNNAYIVAHPGSGALVMPSVPEPASLMLVVLAGTCCFMVRRRSAGVGIACPLLALVLLGAGVTQLQAATPIAYWNFNEASGATALTDSFGTSNSTDIGAATSGGVGKIGNAWNFAGTDSAITINPASGVLTGVGINYSFSGWIKSTDSLGVMLSISDNTEPSEEIALRLSDNAPGGRAGLLGRPSIDGPGNEALSTTFINDNKWHHVAYTSSSTGWSIYVDGVKENSGLVSTSPSAIGANAIHIGVNQDNTAANSGLQWGLLGSLDDFAVWSDPLTTTEVTSLYVKGLYGRGALESFTDALSLQVNRTNGAVSLKNAGGTPFDIDLYRIVSAGNSLQSSNWNSLDDQSFDSNVWTELAHADSKVSEGALSNSTLLGTSLTQPLGNLYKTGVDAQDLVLEYHLVGTPSTLLVKGSVSYVTGGGVNGDYNQNGVVDAADYVVWRKRLGQSALPNTNPADVDGVVTQAEYTYWRSRFGATSAAGSGTEFGGTNVPEPTSLCLLLLFSTIAGFSRRARKYLTGVSVAALLVAAQVSFANVTVDRSYLLGDDTAENGLIGSTVGSATSGVTYDSAGSSGAGDLQDLLVNGDPKYISASTRPGAVGTNRGASFNGDDWLSTNVSLNVPSDTWDSNTLFPTTPFPHNYETILGRGIQMWAKPSASGLGQSKQQGLISDTLVHGIYITPSDTWALRYDTSNLDSGLHVDTVSNNGWTHVMEAAGIDDPINGKSRLVGALFVNGVAVTALSSSYDASTSQLVIGAQSDGTSGAVNHFTGTLDDVRMFVWGNNTGQSGGGFPGQNYGKFDLPVDNDWIAQKLASLGVTNRADVNLNGSVSGNGTGPAATDDVTAFIQGWRSRRLVNGVQVGDWISRQQGDLNYDGIVDLADAYLLRQGLHGLGTGSFDFSLLDGAVPEPSAALLCTLGIGCIGTTRQLRRRSR